MAFVLTTQIYPQTTGPIVSTPNVIILDNDTGGDIIDTISYTLAYSMKWLVTIIDVTNNKARFLEVSAIHRNGISVMHNIFGDVGDRIHVLINVILNGPNVELILTNNSGSTLHVNTVRINTLI
jgi:hypothetical protein